MARYVCRPFALVGLVTLLAGTGCSDTLVGVEHPSSASTGHASAAGSASGSAGASGSGTAAGGSNGTAGATGGTTGSSPCGINAELCNGACVITIDDPNNCGACGNVCSGGDVCVSGACQSPVECLVSSMISCGSSCVDILTDDANCGICGNACPSGTGCSTGLCVPTVPLTGQAPSCPNGGPPTVVSTDAGSVCAGNLAQISFRWAICSCNAIDANGLVYTDSFNSMFGPYVDGGLGGGVGADQDLTLYGAFWVGGSLWGDSTSGFTVAGGAGVGLELHDNGPFTAYGLAGIGSNAFVNGNVSAYGLLGIGGTLYVPTNASVTPVLVNAKGGTTMGAVTEPPPCDCSPSQLIDVASIVATGASHNDDAVIGLDPNALDVPNGLNGIRLDLPCGNYYLTAIKLNGTATLAIHGHTALFIGGDIAPNGGIEIALDPQATLDVFVGGNLSINGETSLGSSLLPSQARFYVAGTQVAYNGNLTLSGNFYTPYANVQPNGNLTVYGSLFAGGYQTNGTTEVHYDSAILSAGRECTDAGPAPGTCSSCRDCGNQACINGACGSCATSADCCAPLVCDNGTCALKFQ